MAYLHGAYGEITASRAQSARQADSVAAYIGTAPINLVRGYADKGLTNMPIRVANMSDAQKQLGYSDDWGTYTLCEAFAQHFDNTVGNIGPIYVVNVLDPATHRKSTATTKQLTFANGRAEFESDTIILDTFAIADKVEGVDYSLEYNYAKKMLTVKLLTNPTTATLSASYSEIDISMVDKEDIIGGTTSAGVYTGLHALKLIYQYYNAVLNTLAAPGWSHEPTVYAAMVAITQKLNGHWDGIVHADIPLEDSEGDAINTIEGAIQWQIANGYISERSKVYWPQVKDGAGRIYHLSTVGSATMLRVDTENNGIPYESPSNKEIMATAQYFGAASNNKGYDQQTCNTLNENGITTACFWGGRWVLWGPHTAAYKYNGDMDARAIFDSNMRMLMHITNSFQLDHGTAIDSPMTPQDKDTILNFEKAKLDTLCGIGALIGTPTVEFIESENPTSDMMNGDFVWNFAATPTPPFKSGTARVCYTDEGFAAFFEE